MPKGWRDAGRIDKMDKGMDRPSGVISVVQRPIMFVVNAHVLYKTDRQKTG